jgi:hypothetical protein
MEGPFHSVAVDRKEEELKDREVEEIVYICLFAKLALTNF